MTVCGPPLPALPTRPYGAPDEKRSTDVPSRAATPPAPKTPTTTATCRLCGGTADDPQTVSKRGRPAEQCVSATFHPRTKRYRGQEVGNAAAAGAILGVSGEQYQWLTRVPPEGPRRAPRHIAHDAEEGWRMYRLSEVRAYRAKRPGRGARTDLVDTPAPATDVPAPRASADDDGS